MQEVKTASNNYKQTKNSIHNRIGDDYEPNKPIVNSSHNREPSDSPSKPLVDGIISDDRLEEIKIDHYNRKLANSNSQDKNTKTENKRLSANPGVKAAEKP